MARTTHSRPIERLADALQDCLNEAAERAVARLEPRLDRQDETLSKQDETLSKQNATPAPHLEAAGRQRKAAHRRLRPVLCREPHPRIPYPTSSTDTGRRSMPER